MQLALKLARKAYGQTSPNPMVGAVVVKDGSVVGQGYHRRAGNAHAEILALRKAGAQARGATLYVTLEPCCHTAKRTPPCVRAVMSSGVSRVVAAMCDPNPLVKGRGIRQLRRAGIAVDVGCLKEKARALNSVYEHWITTGRPYVILKAAMTLDGKIATSTGESKWITGPAARRHVHELRSRVDAIMIGVNTVIHDDPELSVRTTPDSRRAGRKRQPVRVVLDTRLRIMPTARVLRWTLEQPTMVYTTSLASRRKQDRLRRAHVRVVALPQHRGRVSLSSCFRDMARMGITSVLVEGGSELHASILDGGFVNEVRLYVAPVLLGGQDAVSVIGGHSPKRLAKAYRVREVKCEKLGQDLLITGMCGAASPRESR